MADFVVSPADPQKSVTGLTGGDNSPYSAGTKLRDAESAWLGHEELDGAYVKFREKWG